MTPSLPSLEAMVQAKGVEPLILSAAASKTAMYPSSNTPGYMSPLIFDNRRNGTLKPPGQFSFWEGDATDKLSLAGMVGFEPTMLARQINSLLP